MKRRRRLITRRDVVEVFDTSNAMECPECGARAVLPLTPLLLAKQTDGTTHVCHPAAGGCNLGFELLSAEVSP